MDLHVYKIPRIFPTYMIIWAPRLLYQAPKSNTILYPQHLWCFSLNEKSLVLLMKYKMWVDIYHTNELIRHWKYWRKMRKYSLNFYSVVLRRKTFFSRYEYQYCESNTILDKIVVNCINESDLPYKKNKRPEEATIDCFDSFEVTKIFTARKFMCSSSTLAYVWAGATAM